MQYLALVTLVMALGATPVLGDQSSITEAEGYSCMGVDYSKKQTEDLALQDAKRTAVEFSKTYIESETEMENYQLKRDVVQAFARADVQVIDVVDERWDEPATGDCYRIRIKAEVIPAREEMRKASASMINDPRAPLSIQLYTNKEEFVAGEVMKIYLKGNKPFYGRLIYEDASGTKLQILPNPYRSENYFRGGVVYEVPTGDDRFDLTVQGPFGSERLVLYASTSPLGPLDTANLGPVLQVKDETADIARRTRGIAVTSNFNQSSEVAEQKAAVAEFAEIGVDIVTTAQ